MKKIICKSKEITLKDEEYLTSGGEGDIYIKNGLVYKIYQNSIKQDLEKKVKELSILSRPEIIRPLDIVYDLSQAPIGYTMNLADNSVALPLMFTTSFLDRNKITTPKIEKLVQNISNTIKFIHQNKCLIVDGNEFNYLVSKKDYETPYFIDVDSWQTPSFQATAIMPSIRDYKNKDFSTLTDYYSFAVVSFQLFTGIHPYKGKHDIYKTIEERAKNSISVFNKEVRTPSAIRPISDIPASYRDWYEKVFENGERLPPPDSMISKVQMRTKRKYITNKFIIDDIFETKEEIELVSWINGTRVITTKNYIYIESKCYENRRNNSLVCFNEGRFYEVWVQDDSLFYRDIVSNEDGNLKIAAEKIFIINNQLYVLGFDNLFWVEIRKNNVYTMAIIKNSTKMNSLRTKIFKNVLYNKVFNKHYFYIFKEKDSIETEIISELEGYEVWDASYNFAHDKEIQLSIIATDLSGKPWLFKVIKEGIFKEELSSIIEINDTKGLMNKVYIQYNSIEDSIAISVGTYQEIIEDAGLPSDLKLTSNLNNIFFYVDNKLKSFKKK